MGVLTALAVAGAPGGATAQKVRMVGRAIATQAIDQVRYRALCPDCVKGAALTIELTLAAEECGPPFGPTQRCEGSFPLRPGRGNQVAVTIGGRTWTAGVRPVEDVEDVGRISFGYVFGGRPPSDELGVRVNATGPADGAPNSWFHLTLPGKVAVPRVNGAPFMVRGALDEVGALGAVRSVLPGELRGSIDIVACHPARGLKDGSGSAGLDCTTGVLVFDIESITATPTAVTVAPAGPPPYLVVFMEGYGGQVIAANLRQQMTAFEDEHATARPRPTTAYFYYEAEDPARDAVLAFRRRYPGGRVALVGYSMGGNSAYNVAQALGAAPGGGVPVDLLVTLDPVTRTPKISGGTRVGERGRRAPPIPATPRLANVGRWVNVWARGRFVGVNPCEFISTLVTRWQTRPAADDNVPVDGNHCIVREMFTEECVTRSLADLASGTPVAGPCPPPSQRP